ncbi:MAG TPA: SOS response-associated peptidase family protein, partial [Hyphomicrobiaceae bacterium]|nr:SOS response-associated peptidase family protein [Hyphomicrobiaceae bacterium]
ILTTAANATVGRIHDRMPVILAPEAFERWLDCRKVPPAEVADLLVPAPEDLLTITEIDRRIGNPRHEGPDLILPQKQTLL